MKDLRLSKIKKKPRSFFQNIGVVEKGRRKRDTIEYIVKRTYDALPSGLKEYIEDPDQAIKALTNMIIFAGPEAKIKPYEALKQTASYAKKKTGDNTRQFLWNRFRNEESAVYAKFNSYMYRQGLSARNYWFKNVEFENNGSYITATCDLPMRPKGIQYDLLEMSYDFSGQEFYAELS